MLLAGIAGLTAWAVTEPFAPGRIPLESFSTEGRETTRAWMLYEFMFSAALGAFIGMAIAGLTGYYQGSASHVRRGLLIGFVLGAVGGTFGLRIGGMFSEAVFGANVFTNSAAPFFVRVMARMFVFLFFGALIGLVQGIPTKSAKRSIQGLIGGVFGGAIGGAAFDIVGGIVGSWILTAKLSSGEITPGSTTMVEIGALPRALAAVVIGMAIGLFVGLVERIARSAWLRLELGRNEGKEWSVDAAQTFIGKSENAHIPLFGDPNIAPMHACIYRTGSSFRLVDGGAPIGVGVNGIRVPEAPLKHGDVVQIGSYNLRFLTSSARRTAPTPADVARSQSPVALGIDPNINLAQPPTTSPSGISSQPQVPTHALVQPNFSLVAIDGPLSGQRFVLDPQETVAGRESPHIRLDFDNSASRRHCAFVAGAAGVLVRDLGSTNGTLVNGTRVQEMALRPGDTVKIGATTFRLE